MMQMMLQLTNSTELDGTSDGRNDATLTHPGWLGRPCFGEVRHSDHLRLASAHEEAAGKLASSGSA